MANQRANLTGNNITGVSGAQHGAQRNAQAMQRLAGKAGTVGAGGAGGAAGNAGTYEFGSELGGTTGVQLTGNNITGVSGAQHGAQRNAQAMQRGARKGGL